MSNIIDRQIFVFSLDLGLNSTMKTNMNLRFAADELVLKTITYINDGANPDISENIQIWCNVTNDQLIGSFPNSGPNFAPVFLHCDHHFSLSNSFQTGAFELQFQQTGFGSPFFYNPQDVIVGNTTGVVSLTIEFIKHEK